MRDILFRGKRVDNGEWVCGSLDIIPDGRVEIGVKCIAPPDCDPMWQKILITHEVIPETVGQYTGLTDKNGVKIFEGDIVESRASENKEDWKKWTVLFQDGSFCFEREIPKKRKHKYEQNLLCVDEIELYGLTIIGNIHDNSELLGE